MNENSVEIYIGETKYIQVCSWRHSGHKKQFLLENQRPYSVMSIYNTKKREDDVLIMADNEMYICYLDSPFGIENFRLMN